MKGIKVLPEDEASKVNASLVAAVLFATGSGKQAYQHADPEKGLSLFGRALDLKVTGMKLTPGGIYSATCGDRTIAFKIAENAGLSDVATLQRTLRF